jgi:hypothetical protein
LKSIRYEKFTGNLSFSCCLLVVFLLASARLDAQDNYEIQVYGSETVAPKTTMVELHSYGYQWVGDHIRPRFRAPDSWHLPVGLSISNEMGYQRARFFPDTWTWEIRPIIDKQAGRYYLSFNPTLDRAWHGPGVNEGVVFSPDFKIGYDFTKKINAGFEYYGSTGPVFDRSPLHDQQHQFFAVSDLNVSPAWEINFGIGIGVTASTDHLIVKGILGRRFDWGHHKSEP